MNRSVVTYIIFTLITFSTPAYSFDTSNASAGFSNLRESHSILIDEDSVNRARSLYSEAEPELLYAVLDRWIEGWDAAGICESTELDKLSAELKRNVLPYEKSEVLLFLQLLRSQDRLDDVILLPFLKTGKIWKTIRTASKSSDNKFCPTADYLSYLNQKKSERKRYHRYMLSDDLDDSLEKKELTRTQFEWFKGLYDAKFDQRAYLIRKVLPVYLEIRSEHPNAPATPPSKFISTRFGKSRLTPRMALYSKYSAQQIRSLAQLLKEHSEMRFAAKAETIYYDTSGNIKYRHTLTPVARDEDATNELQNKISELLTLHNEFKYTGIALEDIVTAAEEVDVIEGSYVNEALKIDNILNPHVTTSDKIKKWVKKIGYTSMILIPPPYNLVASIAVVLAEAILPKNKMKHFLDEETTR